MFSEGKDPVSAYERRLESARTDREVQDRRERGLAGGRLAVFLLAALGAWLGGGFLTVWFLVPAAGFVALVVAFDRVARERRRDERRIAYYERGLERLGEQWAGKGETGERFRDFDHPYAEDLDLFGAGSLFERISSARTRPGEDRLARWLLNPADPDEIQTRQAAVAELRPGLDLREDVALLGGEIGSVAAFEGLAEWGREAVTLRSTTLRLVAFGLSLATLPALIGWLFLRWGPWPFLVLAGLEAALFAVCRTRVLKVLETVEARAEELAVLAGLLERLERARFESPLLIRLRAALETGGRPASRRIDHLRRLAATLDARRNMLLGPISPLLLWGTQIAFAVERWRSETGGSIGGWLDAVGEFEALASLAGFAFENPEDVFPELADEGPRFEAEGLAHPLLPRSAVRNDVSLGGERRLLVISGSNMSGKSTLLRAVGTSIVLAQSGGTVRARRLVLSPLSVGATLRVQDSLKDGKSRFFAEILRLRRVLDLAKGSRGLLFLLDEILAGTNSHDRRLGAEAVVMGLVERGAIGLVTTHDLALAEITERLNGQAANVHFADHLEDGQMRFDYTMRPGVVNHSNALALMRSVGLDV